MVGVRSGTEYAARRGTERLPQGVDAVTRAVLLFSPFARGAAADGGGAAHHDEAQPSAATGKFGLPRGQLRVTWEDTDVADDTYLDSAAAGGAEASGEGTFDPWAPPHANAPCRASMAAAFRRLQREQ